MTDATEPEQRTDEWRQMRCGWLGASQLHEALAKTKTGWGASRANLLARLAVERLTGKPQETYVNAAMQHGIDTEAEARAAYQFEVGALVKPCSFFRHPTIFGTGASPDGLVGDDGLLETKCPTPATHINTLTGASIPQMYRYQMAWQIACTGRAWVDFVSYSPAFPENMRLHVQRVHRDDKQIAELETQVREFLSELDAKIAALTSRYGTPAKEAA